MGRMTHQSVLSGFIPRRRKGDAGKHWHLEMTALFTDHSPECPLYSRQGEATGSETNCFFIVCRSKEGMVIDFSQREFLAGHTDAKKLNITDFKAFCYDIKISVLYMLDSTVSKAVF